MRLLLVLRGMWDVAIGWNAERALERLTIKSSPETFAASEVSSSEDWSEKYIAVFCCYFRKELVDQSSVSWFQVTYA